MRRVLIRFISLILSAILSLAGLFGLNRPDLFARYGLPSFADGIHRGTYESAGGTLIARYAWTLQSDFDAYVASLRAAGFTLYDENTIDANRFAALYKDETAVFVSSEARTSTPTRRAV